MVVGRAVLQDVIANSLRQYQLLGLGRGYEYEAPDSFNVHFLGRTSIEL
jgi:hypothetical protein